MKRAHDCEESGSESDGESSAIRSQSSNDSSEGEEFRAHKRVRELQDETPLIVSDEQAPHETEQRELTTTTASLSTQIFTAPSILRSRAEMLRVLDSFVDLFNTSNFQAILISLYDISATDMKVQTTLKAEEASGSLEDAFNDDICLSVQPKASPDYLKATTATSVYMVWLLLHRTHRNPGIQIIDRRICHRKVLRTSAFSGSVHTVSDPQLSQRSGIAAVSPANAQRSSVVEERATDQPVSIVEVVMKLNGACTTAKPLQDLLIALTADEIALDCLDAALVVSALDAKVTTLLQGPTTENTGPSASGPRAAEQSSLQPQPLVRQRQYLLEMRLIFDRFDRITDWTTTMLAAEDA